jgi:hypothetical protein
MLAQLSLLGERVPCGALYPTKASTRQASLVFLDIYCTVYAPLNIINSHAQSPTRIACAYH